MEATLPIWPLTSLQKQNSHEGHLLILPSPILQKTTEKGQLLRERMRRGGQENGIYGKITIKNLTRKCYEIRRCPADNL